jgi:sterol desaturase/sphingolipid hydroxylase (fatty acid hydroxylase superfamily)
MLQQPARMMAVVVQIIFEPSGSFHHQIAWIKPSARSTMQLSKFNYYSDYVAYPVVIGALATMSLVRNGVHDMLVWAAAILGGMIFWTLAEYWIHRVALHRYGAFVTAHAMHHAAPRAYIGTPIWISIPTLFGAILMPLWYWFGFNIASGALAGVMTGYTWYGLLHHLIHHLKKPPALSYLRNLQAQHVRHHYSPDSGNFGVTTGIWDRLFGTFIGSMPATRR